MFGYVYKNASYRIEHFYPDHRRLDKILSHGFSIHLELEVAQKLINIKLPKDHLLNDIGLRYIQTVFGKCYDNDRLISYRSPFDFYKDSILVSHVNVPGNACSLDINSNNIKDLTPKTHLNNLVSTAISWEPHNVDSRNQAFTLLSLWLLWYESAMTYI